MSDVEVFRKYLEKTRLEIKLCLETHLTSQKPILAEIDDRVSNSLLDALISFSGRGKMFRAAVLGLGFRPVAYRMEKEVPPLIQSGVELIQSGLLIQDDIVDRDETRRGLPTIHRMFSTAYQDNETEGSKEDADEIGRGLAMVSSDLAIVLAYHLFLNSGFPADIIIKATSQLNSNLIKTAIGQAMDVALHSRSSECTDHILKAALYKTAYYTVVGPMQLGATLAGANEVLLANIETFGCNIGLAYQLRDDILDIFPNVLNDNRRQWSDISGNKRTFLIENTIRMTSGKERDIFLKSLGKTDHSSEEMDTVREIIERSGALSLTNEKAQSLARQGEALIPCLTDNPSLAQLLRGVCCFAVDRED